MKKTNLFFAILGVMLLASCKSEIDCPENPLSTVNHVRFNSTIGEMTKTRASGTTWDTGDAIGIYALNEGQTLSDQAIYDGKQLLSPNLAILILWLITLIKRPLQDMHIP